MNDLLLEDFSFLDKMQILTEDVDKGERIYKLRGVFSKIGVINKNRRYYSEAVMRPVVEGLQPIIEDGGFVGELDHPPTPKINMREISHKITALAIAEDGSIVGEMIPTSGPAGQILKSYMVDKIRLGVSTRGTGSVRPYNGPLAEGIQGVVEVAPGYKMRAIDIVFDPSAGTFPEQVLENSDFGMFTVPSGFKSIWDDVFGK